MSEKQCIAIGGCTHGRLGCDIATGAWPVLDDELLAEPLRQPINPWARRRKIELAELVNEPWVLPPPRSVVASLALETFRARGLDYPRTIVVTESPQARFNLPATGSFLTMLSASALRFPIRRTEIKVLPVQLAMAPEPTGILTLKNRTLSSLARLFIKHAREVAKLLAKPR